MKNVNSGFTLIEVLIVIAIVGILASVAMPFYKGYTIKARLSEVVNAMGNVGSAVSAFRQDNEAWPNCPTLNEIRNSLGVGLGSLTRVAEMSIANGVITATIQNIDPIVNNEQLILTPTLRGDGSFTWTWGNSAGFPTRLKPMS